VPTAFSSSLVPAPTQLFAASPLLLPHAAFAAGAAVALLLPLLLLLLVLLVTGACCGACVCVYKNMHSSIRWSVSLAISTSNIACHVPQLDVLGVHSNSGLTLRVC
jgi:hypothetical protein